jgi:hypothetical protein
MSGISLANVDLGTVLSGAGQLFKDIRTAITGKEPLNADKAAEIALKVQEIEASILNAQAQINLVEASSTNIFVAGWRPAAGWCCVLGLIYSVFLRPMISWIATMAGASAVPPVIDDVMLMQLLFGMLGLGALRTYEKIKGTN